MEEMIKILKWRCVHVNINVVLERTNARTVRTIIGADSTEATGTFAPVLMKVLG
jgi:hypothetical protein